MMRVKFKLTNPFIEMADTNLKEKIKEEIENGNELFKYKDIQLTCTGELMATIDCYGHLAESIIEQLDSYDFFGLNEKT